MYALFKGRTQMSKAHKDEQMIIIYALETDAASKKVVFKEGYEIRLLPDEKGGGVMAIETLESDAILSAAKYVGIEPERMEVAIKMYTKIYEAAKPKLSLEEIAKEKAKKHGNEKFWEHELEICKVVLDAAGISYE